MDKLTHLIKRFNYNQSKLTGGNLLTGNKHDLPYLRAIDNIHKAVGEVMVMPDGNPNTPKWHAECEQLFKLTKQVLNKSNYFNYLTKEETNDE